MKKFISIFCLFSVQAWSECNVFIKDKHFSYEGKTLHHDFEEILKRKGYYIVGEKANADSILVAMKVDNKVNSAATIVSLDYFHEGRYAKACSGKICQFEDYVQSFEQSFKDFIHNLPKCGE